MIFRNSKGYAQIIPPKFSGRKCLIYFTFIVALLSCLDGKEANAQSVEMPSVVRPSPRSREFEKFVDYKVSLFNGLAQTDLVFYNIELDGVNLPIGISYHGSGIKFNQITGDVGLGWQLKPDFRVSRTVYGRLDEAYTMPNMTNVSGGQAIIPYLGNSFATPFARDLYLARYHNISPGSEAPAVVASQNSYLDGQFDMFTIAFPGQNGNFIVTDRTNKVVTPLNNAALNKIGYTISNSIISEFTATDGHANQYKFGAPDANNEGRQIGGIKYNTAWMLSEIATPFANKITLGYQTFQESSQTLPVFNQTFIEGKTFPFPSPLCYQTIESFLGSVSPSTATTYDSKILSTISTPNEVVTFNRNANGTISSIVVAKPGGGQIKKISFVYDGRFLDEVQIAGTDNAVIEKYAFAYTSKDVSFRNYDCFGYGTGTINGVDEPRPNTYGRFDYSRVISDCSQSMSFIDFTGQDKRAARAYDSGMLKKITFPTGGTRTFFYESNQYEVGSPATVIAQGGFRIQSITDSDPSGSPAVERRYVYGKGVRTVDPTDPRLSVSQGIILAYNSWGPVGSVHGLKRTNYSSLVDPEITEGASQANNGWYETVTELFNEGKIEYKYELPRQYTNVSEYPTNYTVNLVGARPSYVSAFHPWSTPILKEAAIYKGTGTATSLVRKENYEYYIPNPSPSDEFVGLKVIPFALVKQGYNVGAQTSEPLYSLYTDSGIQSVFNYATTVITRGDVLLKKKSITDYDPSGAGMTTSSEYDYTSYNLVKSEKNTTSKGEIELVKYKYPFNYTGITQTDNISSGIKKLTDINMVNPAIETSRFIQAANGTNSRLVSSIFSSYKSSIPVPDKAFELAISLPIANFSESAVSAGTVTKDTRYEERISFDEYNSKGRILQRGKPGDTKEVYLWGYNNQYPVAKVIGSDFATASALINQTILDNGGGSTSEAQMKTELNKLRSLSNAQVYTYTYLPLVGMASETDPAGKTTSYEYDHYNRLQTAKNASGAITASYCYNYAGQVVECAGISPTGSVTAGVLELWGDPALPVTLIEFNAAKQENKVQLSWSTSTEANSDHFDVERSNDGKHWDKLGTVTSAGESSTLTKYEFFDQFPRAGENLYRLKMVDKDETYSFSRIRSVSIDQNGNVVFYPNPITVGQKLNLLVENLSAISKIAFVNSIGTTVLESTAKREINTTALTPGLYVVIVTYADGSTTTHRIVKQ